MTCSPHVYFDLMRSLDRAFAARQGVGETLPDSWGERFFNDLAKKGGQWRGQTTLIYMTAGKILYRFALTQPDIESGFVDSLIRRPEAFLNMVLVVVKNTRYAE
jgi:hypothetical protein